MATIQIRELPEETYETIRRRARAQGQSIQAYMRERAIEDASTPTSQELWESISQLRASDPAPGSSTDSIVAEVRALRGE